MTWTHNVTGVENNGDSVRVFVSYTDGSKTILDSINTTSPSADMNWLKGQISQKINGLDALSTFASGVGTGALDLTPPTPPTPTDAPLPIVISTPFSQSSFIFDGDGVSGTCTAGGNLTLDYLINPNDHPMGQKLNGGMIIVKGGTHGDWIECSVEDAGNILPSPYTGAQLEKWINKWYVPEDGHIFLQTPYAGLVPDGFYLRIVYHSIGATDVKVAMNYLLHTPA